MTQQQIEQAGQQAIAEAINLYSVTTLIKEGLGTGKALVWWNAHTPTAWAADHIDVFADLVKVNRDQAIKTALDARWVKSGKAAARGTEIHAAAEKIALGQEAMELDDELQPYLDQYLKFLDKHQPEFLMSEAPVYAPSQHYAGTCDGIMVLQDQTVIFDYKTTDKDPGAKSRPPYPEVALQLAAYSRAELVGVLSEMRETNYGRYYVYTADQHHEPMPSVDGAVCIVISPYDCRVVPVRIDDEVFRAFLHVRECARWQIDISKRVLGPEITG